MKLNLFSFFHLNLAYSAIEESDRERVIQNCYWPLLRLAKNLNLPFGVELSGYTLQTIAEIDSEWIEEFKSLIQEGPCELIGSGYSQIIGPLVPPEVTTANLKIGNEIYQDLLGVQPSIALLNEQAFSSGLVSLYGQVGYKALIMEWNNPAREHPEWNKNLRYLPQRVKGAEGEELGLIWNKSISFQKFQRYVHAEIDIKEMFDYVGSHIGDQIRALPLYGNDVEIFDFRPGRYMTEAAIQQDGEWKRIEDLYLSLLSRSEFQFIKPSEVLKLNDQTHAGQLLSLSTAGQPIPVKKQQKYNILRWAITGRDDFSINTRCWRLFQTVNTAETATIEDWKELCYLWSSDFRTHITDKRWENFLDRLESFEKRWESYTPTVTKFKNLDSNSSRSNLSIKVEKIGNILHINGDRLNIQLNCLRGLALESYIDLKLNSKKLFGTLPHGYFDDIRFGADYYSGQLIFESPGQHKVTDLQPVQSHVHQFEGGVLVKGTIETSLGQIEKSWVIDDSKGEVILKFKFDWLKPVLGSLRFGHITLNPEIFSSSSIYFSTHNGGLELENFAVDTNIDHGRPVSFLVSANQGLGMTGGLAELGDSEKGMLLKFSKEQAALVGLVSSQQIDNKHLTRLAISAREMDDTSMPAPFRNFEVELKYSAFSREFELQ